MSDDERHNGERYRRLFEDAQEGIAISTPEGEIKEVNPAAAEIFGYSREELRSMNAAELYVDPEERKIGTEELHKKGALQNREFRLRRADGEEIVCQLSVTMRRGEEGKPVIYQSFFRDVTERKQAEKALKESEETFRKLAENAIVGIGLLQGGIYKYLNPALEQMTGYSREELLGESPKCFIHPDEWPEVQARIQRREQGETDEGRYQTRFRTKSGQTRLIEVAATRITYQGTPAVIATLLDVTERQQMQREILRTQEKERKSLGQYLHDGIASQLTGATLRLSTLAAKAQEERAAEEIREIQEIIQEGAGEVRRLSRGLNPRGLSEGDLASALEGLAQNTANAYFEGPDSWADDAEPEELDGETATHLYRIAQEAVVNAQRHGEGEEIIIGLEQEDDTFVLMIEDDGKGFHPEKPSEEGLGLRSMRYRAELLGAELTIDSSPGEGTLVRCHLPE